MWDHVRAVQSLLVIAGVSGWAVADMLRDRAAVIKSRFTAHQIVLASRARAPIVYWLYVVLFSIVAAGFGAGAVLFTFWWPR
jgi:hypothetical protein